MDVKKYISDNIVYADKLHINKGDDLKTIINKFSNFYNNNYYETMIKINNHATYVNKDVLKPLVEELYGYWDQINQIKTIDYKDTFCDEIFHSLSIESIQSSRRIIKDIVNNKPYDNQLINNMYISYLSIQTIKPKIDLDYLKLIYQILTSNIDMGNEKLDGTYFREDEVCIGVYNGSQSRFVLSDMKSLLDYINSDIDKQDPVLKILLVHLCFELIHPYYDMNGRTGRILAWWMNYIKYQLPNLAYFSISTCHFRETYLKAFNETKKSKDIDLTYELAKLIQIFILQAKNYLIVNQINEYVFDKHKINLNSLQKSILMRYLAHQDIYNKPQNAKMKMSEIWDYFKDYSQQMIYREIKKLENYKLFICSDTNPKEIKAKFWSLINIEE